MTGGLNTNDTDPLAQPVESLAESNPGHPVTAHQAPGPTPAEHSEALATSTTQVAGTLTEVQADVQSGDPSHDGRLEEPETRETSGEAEDRLKVEHQPGDVTSGLVSEPPSRHDRAEERLAGSAEGVKLSTTADKANAKQDCPIEIDDSPPEAPVRSARKRRTKDDTATESPPARQKLRQSPSKTNEPMMCSSPLAIPSRSQQYGSRWLENEPHDHDRKRR